MHFAVQRKQRHEAAIGGEGEEAHDSAADHGLAEGMEEIRVLMQRAADEDIVNQRHAEIAQERPDGRTVDVDAGNRDDDPVDGDLQKRARDQRDHGKLFLPRGLQDRVFHQHDADEEGGEAHDAEQAGAGLMRARIEDVHNREGQHRKAHAHRHGDDGGDAHRVLGGFGRLIAAAAGNRPGNGRHNGDGQRRHEGRREVEERLHLAVHAEEHAGMVLGKAGSRQAAVADARVQRRQNRHDAGPQGNRNADAQDVVNDAADALGRLAGAGSGALVVPLLINHHIGEGNDRADGHTENRAGRGLGQTVAGPDKPARDQQAGDDLEEDLEHLVHGGRDHVAVALAVAPVGRDQAHQENGRGHGTHAERRVGLTQIEMREPLVAEEHDHPEEQADDGKGQKGGTEGLFLGGRFALGVRHGDHAGKGHGEAGGRQGKEDVVDVVGRKKNPVAVVAEDVPQRDLVDGPENLHDDHADRQDGGPVHEILLFLCGTAHDFMMRRAT